MAKMANLFKVGEYKYHAEVWKVEDCWKDKDIRGPEPTQDFLHSVETMGIVYPIIVTSYQDNMYLIDGGRRIKAARKLDIPLINVNVFEEVNPIDQKAWSIILNERRSINPVTEFLYLQQLKKEERWEEIGKTYRFNAGHLKKIASLENLRTDLFLDAFQHGKIAESTLFAIAKLGSARQAYLEQTLNEKGKITATDVKAAKRARATAVLEAAAGRFETVVPEAHKERTLFVIMVEDTVLPTLFEDFHSALQHGLEQHGKVYRLVEVS